MPRRLVVLAWIEGEQSAHDLAAHFGVSRKAMKVRLRQLGLAADGDQAASGDKQGADLVPPSTYYRRTGIRTAPCGSVG
jgi:Zn-dependent peptidase ImmA (M78 family)